MRGIIRAVITATWVLLALVGCTRPGGNAGEGASGAGTPGWTGRSLVVGSHSTAPDPATARQQNWSAGGAGSGGGGAAGGM